MSDKAIKSIHINVYTFKKKEIVFLTTLFIKNFDNFDKISNVVKKGNNYVHIFCYLKYPKS